MILIVVKWTIRPEYADSWLDRVRDFTDGTRGEPGNLFFEWSRSVADPHQYYLVEGFADADAGRAHVGTDHFAKAMAWLPDVVATRPSIIHVPDAPGSGWAEMAEVTPR
jgi:quinol monooxygenase YgiN